MAKAPAQNQEVSSSSSTDKEPTNVPVKRISMHKLQGEKATTQGPPAKRVLRHTSDDVVMLPPCRICGARSSGLHYGVIACEACKTFYRRQLPHQSKLHCSDEGRCIMRPRYRQNCAACRLKKCLDVGMSLDGIKIGRYTLERHTENITELKTLELQKKMTDDGEMVTTQSEERSKSLDKVIHDLCTLYTEALYKHAPNYSTVHDMEQQYMEQQQLEEQLYGRRKLLSSAEYQAIYTQTGLDIDGRRAVMAQVIEAIECMNRTILSFAQTLPGFNRLSLAEQKRLLAKSTLSRWSFLFSGFFNTDLRLMSCPKSQNLIVSADGLSIFINNPEDRQTFWVLMHRIQQLDLTEEESVMSAALAAFCIDDDMGLGSGGYTFMSAAMEYVAEALQHLLLKNHDPEDRTFSKIVLILALMIDYKSRGEAIKQHFLQESKGLQLPEVADFICRTM